MTRKDYRVLMSLLGLQIVGPRNRCRAVETRSSRSGCPPSTLGASKRAPTRPSTPSPSLCLQTEEAPRHRLLFDPPGQIPPWNCRFLEKVFQWRFLKRPWPRQDFIGALIASFGEVGIGSVKKRRCFSAGFQTVRLVLAIEWTRIWAL